MIIGSKEYKLILLDTNALREIVTNTNLAGKGFLEKFFVQTTELYAPCFSIYNVIELMPYKDIYEKFLEFFSVVSCFMIFPIKNIFSKEVKCMLCEDRFVIDNKIANAFTPLRSEENYNFKIFLGKIDKEIMNNVKLELAQFSAIAIDWEKRRMEAEK